MSLIAQNLCVDDRIDDVSLMLEKGRITAICGPNGAGKSTFLQILAGLLEPDAGSILLDDSPLTTKPPSERAKHLGYLPQQAEIAWDVPVRKLVELGRYAHRDDRSEPVDAAIQSLDLHHLETRRAQTLSGGETARVLLARVLAGEPGWILADEPLAALDLAHQLTLVGHLKAAAADGAGVVLVLHDLALAMNHAHRVVVLDRGRVAADGAPEQALGREVIGRVWGVAADWIGEHGRKALITGA